MKKTIVVLTLLLILIWTTFAVADNEYSNIESSILNGDNFEEIARKGGGYSVDKYKEYKDGNEVVGIYFYFIPDNVFIDYDLRGVNSLFSEGYFEQNNDYKHLFEFEEELKEDYFLVLNEVYIRENGTDLILYEYINSLEIVVDGNIYNCKGLYDVVHSASVGAVLRRTSYRGRLRNYKIGGYLLFPKIDLDGVGEVKIRTDFFEEDLEYMWDVEKINQLIDIFK